MTTPAKDLTRASHLDAITEAEARLAKVAVWLAMQAERPSVNWTNIGDVQHVSTMLKEIVEFVNCTDE